jgi:hypothetical protein
MRDIAAVPAAARLRELTFFLWRRERTKITNELLFFLVKSQMS